MQNITYPVVADFYSTQYPNSDTDRSLGFNVFSFTGGGEHAIFTAKTVQLMLEKVQDYAAGMTFHELS